MLTRAQLLTFCVHLKGVQAQTVANFYLAFEAQLAIIPVINKVNASTLHWFTLTEKEEVITQM